MNVLLFAVSIVVIIAVARWRRVSSEDDMPRAESGIGVSFANVLHTHNYRLALIAKETTFEWCADMNAATKWLIAHPYGPASEIEHDEWRGLLLNEIGSYILCRQAHGMQLDTAYIESLWEQTEFWRA